jgi:hypothetical protein
MVDPINSALVDSSNYIEQLDFFNFVQDPGIDMTEEEIQNTKSRKNRHFKHLNKWYSGIHDLCGKLYDVYEGNPEVFPKLGKSKTNQVKKMCKWVLTKRLNISRADVNKIVEPSITPYIQASGSEITNFFVLGQAEILRLALQEWSGESLKDKQKPTDNDRIRVMGILFSEDFRDDIGILLESAKSDRQGVDDPKLSQSAVFTRLHNSFSDVDVIVEHPDNWDREETKEKIGEEVWKCYDPNDEERIKVPREKAQMKYIFNQVMVDYKKIMDMYTKGTGGGDGDPASYVNWSEREDLSIMRYHNHSTSQYLTWVFMFDKQFGFILTKRKGPLPEGTGLDDNIPRTRSMSFSASGGSERDKTPSDNMFLNELRLGREDAAKQSTEMRSIFADFLNEPKAAESDGNLASRMRTSAEVLKEICEVRSAMKGYEEDLSFAISSQKRKIPADEKNRKEKKKKMKRTIGRLESAIDTFETTLDCLMKELRTINEAKVNDGGSISDGTNGSNNDSDSDSDSDRIDKM